MSCKKPAPMECTISNDPKDWSVSRALSNGCSVYLTYFPNSQVMVAYGNRVYYSYIWLREENLREFCGKVASAKGNIVYVAPTTDYVGGLIRFQDSVMPEVREFFREGIK